MNHDTFRTQIRKRFELLSNDSQIHRMPFLGKDFLILPQVFSPKLFSESIWFGEQLQEISGCKSLLEVGCGTGIISLMCALKNSAVEATDINEQAVRNAQINFENYGVSIPTYVGDVFSGVLADKKYDIIFWNHPFNYSKITENNVLLRSVFDKEYNSLETYVAQARNYLKPRGRLLLGTANLANEKKIEDIAYRHGYALKELARSKCEIVGDSFELYCSVVEFVPKTVNLTRMVQIPAGSLNNSL